MCEALVQSAVELFEARFGEPPQYAAIAPGRVNLIGEHTDYNNGFAMPMAVERHTVMLAAPASTPTSKLYAADLSETVEVDLAQSLQPLHHSFATYIMGVAQQFQQVTQIPAMKLLVTGDVPRASGLSSSASVEVAAATLFTQLTSVHFTDLEIALLCQRAEQQFVGVPCGVMDMYVIAMGRKDHALLIDCQSLEYELVPFRTDDVTLLVIDTGVQRTLVTGEYAKRRHACEEAARQLGVESLRQATVDMVDQSSLDDDLRRKATHVITENHRVQKAAEALGRHDLAALGKLMFASHESLRDCFEVSIDELNLIVETAQRLHDADQGVYGARMTGAGFGGCAIALCRTTAVHEVSRAIVDAFAQRFGRTPELFATRAADGARPISLNAPELNR